MGEKLQKIVAFLLLVLKTEWSYAVIAMPVVHKSEVGVLRIL